MISHYSRKFSKLLPCTEVLYLQMLPTVKNTFFRKFSFSEQSIAISMTDIS